MDKEDLVAIVEIALVGAKRSEDFIKHDLDMSDEEFSRLMGLANKFNNTYECMENN